MALSLTCKLDHLCSREPLNVQTTSQLNNNTSQSGDGIQALLIVKVPQVILVSNQGWEPLMEDV